ncbi:MAG: helix-turn-helix domain-containing protein [Chthoniobacterales bacterium]|nr:helix-turn-helix domain-containing protein [Chthoniobacterales bacterium]
MLVDIKINELENLLERLEALEILVKEKLKPKKRFYTIPEAAEYLHISVKSVRKFVDSGRLKKRLGEYRILIPVESLEEFCKQSLS